MSLARRAKTLKLLAASLVVTACTGANPLYVLPRDGQGSDDDPPVVDASPSGRTDGSADISAPAVDAAAASAEVAAGLPEVARAEVSAAADAAASPDAPLKQGLLGEYFAGRSFDTARLHMRVDQEINFPWRNGSPVPGVVPVDNFCVRWTGKVQPLTTGEYTFTTRTDDGARLYVGGIRLINAWDVQTESPHAGKIQLTAGERYDIEMHYFEQAYTATAKLYWSGPSQPEEIVPYDRLSH